MLSINSKKTCYYGVDFLTVTRKPPTMWMSFWLGGCLYGKETFEYIIGCMIICKKKLRVPDWLKTSALSCNTGAKLYHACKLQIARAHAFKILSVLTSCDVFSCTLLRSNNMISLAIWCNKHLQIFQRPQMALALRARAILLSSKNVYYIYIYITYT